MNRGERRVLNERKWKSKVKKLWNKWGKKVHFWRKDGLKEFDTVKEFAESEFAQTYKHTSSPYKKEHTKKEFKSKTINLDEYDSLCSECQRYNTDDCSYSGKVNYLTKWKDINCKDFEN